MRGCWSVVASELASSLAAFRFFASSDRTMLNWAMGFYTSDSLFGTIPRRLPMRFTSAAHALQIRSSCVFFTYTSIFHRIRKRTPEDSTAFGNGHWKIPAHSETEIKETCDWLVCGLGREC